MYLSQADSEHTDPDPVYVLRSSTDDITSLVHNGDIIITGSINGKIKFWKTLSKRVISELDSGCSSGVLKIQIIDQDAKKFLISHNRSGKIKFWHLKSFSEIELMTAWNIPAIGFCSIGILKSVTNNGCFIGFPIDNSNVGVKLFSFDQSDHKTLLLQPKERKGMVMHLKLFSLAINDDTAMSLLAGYEDGTLAIWDVHKQTLSSSIKLFDDPIMALCLDVKTMRVLASSAGKKLKSVKFNEMLNLDLLDTVQTQFSGCSAMAIRHDSKLVFVGGWDGRVRIYSWKKMKLLAVLKYHTETINCICFDEKNNAIIGCKDGKISLWNIYAT